jgi:hypothetical protein
MEPFEIFSWMISQEGALRGCRGFYISPKWPGNAQPQSPVNSKLFDLQVFEVQTTLAVSIRFITTPGKPLKLAQ